MIAYFILVHRYPKQFKHLFKSIYMPGNQYVIHIDKSSGKTLAQDITRFSVEKPKIYLRIFRGASG